MLEKLKKSFVPALIHALYSIIYFLFVVPFDLWVKAVERLAKQKENGSLRISSIDSPWPFLSFIKAILLEFLFDLFIFLSYFIGIVLTIYGLFEEGGEALLILIAAYYAPLALSAARDFFTILILPIRKFISWCRKPAQYLDLKVEKKEIS